MGQHAGFFQHGFCDGGYIVQRARIIQFGQRFPRGPVAQFRFFAQGKQGFLATHVGAGAAQCQHVFFRHVGLGDVPGCLGEGAVVADVAAQLRQGDKHLS